MPQGIELPRMEANRSIRRYICELGGVEHIGGHCVSNREGQRGGNKSDDCRHQDAKTVVKSRQVRLGII